MQMNARFAAAMARALAEETQTEPPAQGTSPVMGLQQTTRGRLFCSASVDWLNIALQNTAPARC
jgi:hypothetical protein